jgi:hypothetical protein
MAGQDSLDGKPEQSSDESEDPEPEPEKQPEKKKKKKKIEIEEKEEGEDMDLEEVKEPDAPQAKAKPFSAFPKASTIGASPVNLKGENFNFFFSSKDFSSRTFSFKPPKKEKEAANELHNKSLKKKKEGDKSSDFLRENSSEFFDKNSSEKKSLKKSSYNPEIKILEEFEDSEESQIKEENRNISFEISGEILSENNSEQEFSKNSSNPHSLIEEKEAANELHRKSLKAKSKRKSSDFLRENSSENNFSEIATSSNDLEEDNDPLEITSPSEKQISTKPSEVKKSDKRNSKNRTRVPSSLIQHSSCWTVVSNCEL